MSGYCYFWKLRKLAEIGKAKTFVEESWPRNNLFPRDRTGLHQCMMTPSVTVELCSVLSVFGSHPWDVLRGWRGSQTPSSWPSFRLPSPFIYLSRSGESSLGLWWTASVFALSTATQPHLAVRPRPEGDNTAEWNTTVGQCVQQTRLGVSRRHIIYIPLDAPRTLETRIVNIATKLLWPNFLRALHLNTIDRTSNVAMV